MDCNWLMETRNRSLSEGPARVSAVARCLATRLDVDFTLENEVGWAGEGDVFE